MKIDYCTGDFLTGTETWCLHSCNARGGFASGAAGAVRKAYPHAYEMYRDAHLRGALRLGEIIWANCGAKIIGNAITQDDYGRDPGRVYVDYEAVRAAMRNLDILAQRSQDPSQGLAPFHAVAMIAIGSGLANGSWQVIAPIIEQEALHFQPVVYLLDGRMPTS